MDYDDPRAARDAKRLLAALLPKARARLRREGPGAVAANPAVEAMAPFVREANLRGVYVYRQRPPPDGGGLVRETEPSPS